jgi:hypothetical protein
MEPCEHVGFHTGRGRYDQAAERLRYVVVCDDCEAEVRELETEEYRPQFTPQDLPGAA